MIARIQGAGKAPPLLLDGPGGDGFTRMCYATEYSKIEEALHRMEKFMTRYG